MDIQSTKVVLRINAGPGADSDAKGDPVTLATLAVTLAPIALKSVTDLLQSWLSRHERASVTLESGGTKITLTGTPSQDQMRMVEDWVARVKA